MKISNVKHAAEVAFKSGLTLTLVGESGKAKTTIWKQIYKELGFKSLVIFRPALMADSADLIGLPEFEVVTTEVNGKTITERTTNFLHPKWLKLAQNDTLVVVDEINRTSKDIINGLFGLVEGEGPHVGDLKLNSSSKVVATMNPSTDNYAGTLDLSDDAWASRLCFIKVEGDLDGFVQYGRDSKNVAPVMLDFLTKNPKFYANGGSSFTIDEVISSDSQNVGEKFCSNDRTKEKVSKAYTFGKELGKTNDVIFEVIQGLAGSDVATAFLQYAETYTNVVTLADLCKNKTNHKKFNYDELSGISKVLEDLKFAIDEKKITKPQFKNVSLFLQQIPIDTLKGFLLWLVNTNTDDETGTKKSTFADIIVDNAEIDGKIDLFQNLEVAVETAIEADTE